ncbi:MAG: hypothetical protein ABFD89_10595, partial [Bryobacteraceae bacterium]
RIKDIPTTATTAAADDYIVIDGATNKVRKGLASNLITATAAAAVAGHDASAGAHHLGRKRMLVFGNSVAEQSAEYLYLVTTTTSAEAAAGQRVIVVASAAGFAEGGKLSTKTCSGTLWKTSIASINGTSITLADDIPELIRSGASIRLHSTVYPVQTAQGLGLASAANMVLGYPFELSSVYGYGGAATTSMLQSLGRWLDYFRPAVCVLHLFENDMAGSAGIDELKFYAKTAARECVSRNCIPVVCSSLPSSTLGASRAGVFDALVAYITGELATDVPGCVGVDCSTKWLDTSNATYPRSPIAGWTDGIHPASGHKFQTAALTLVPALAGLSGVSEEIASLSPYNSTRAGGTGGANSGFVAGSVSPAGWNLYAYGGKVIATTTRNVDGTLRITADWRGLNVVRGTDYISLGYTFTHPTAWPVGNVVRGYLKSKIRGAVGVSEFTVSAKLTEDATFTSAAGIGAQADIGAHDTPVIVHTPQFEIPAGNTTFTLMMTITTPTSAASTGLVVIDIAELGLMAAAGNIKLA